MPAPAMSADLVLAQLDTLPTLPAAAVRILELTADPDVPIESVIRVLRGDQALTARILAAVAAAPTGVRERITSLERAVPLLGLRTVRNLVLAATLFDRFGPKAPGSGTHNGFDRAAFWKHSIAVACAARRLSAGGTPQAIAPEDAYLAGLLHDLGKVALDAVFPKAFARAVAMAEQSRGDLADCERDVLGIDHTVAGRRLADRWRLPHALCDVIWLHHLAPDAVPATVSQPQLVALVQIADTLAREHGIGHSGNFAFYDHSPGLAARVGLGEHELAAATALLPSDVAEQAQLLGLEDSGDPAARAALLQRANAELARTNLELTEENRRLATENRYLAAAVALDSALTEWSDPARVATAAALVLRKALPALTTAVWHVRRNGGALDLATIAPRDSKPTTTTQRPPEALEHWLRSECPGPFGTISPAPAPLASLLQARTALAPDAVLYHLPFEPIHAGRGGVLLAMSPREHEQLAQELGALRAAVAVIAAAFDRADEQVAAQRLSEDLAETNRRLQQTQTELLRSRSLAMIAEMAAGAGHELNGPLAVISGRAQMLARASDDPETHRILKTISDKAHECSGIVTELMDFARPQPMQSEPVNLAALITEARDRWLRDSGLPPSVVRVEDTARYGGGPPVVRGDAPQLHTVMRELLSNATDAIAEEGGLIVLTVHARDDDTIELTVQDNGCGMSPSTLQRAFDPFFSHRRAGRRRGLGLPRAFRIVEAHGGRIWLESRVGEGTTARVRLPRQR